MSSAIVFCPRPDLSRNENFVGFIGSARNDLHVFGADLKFTDNVWDLTDHIDLKGRGNKRVRINFYAFSSDKKSEVPIREPFLSFAKAYYRYMHGLRPKKFVQARLYALKAVYQALDSELRTSEIASINGHVFDTAAEIIRKRYDPALAYRVGGDLEQLAAFLTENDFTAIPVRWRNTLPRPKDTQRVGKEFDERRAAKMPSEGALDALPQAFHLAKQPTDVIVTSVTAILLGAPSRISEVLLLPENCEVTQQTEDDTRVLLRWWPSKGAPPMLKPVYSGMSQVISDAISKLKAATAPAREIAYWYENNPGHLFLPPGTEHLRNRTYLTTKEVAQIIGVDKGGQWCRVQKIPWQPVDGKKAVLFRDVEDAVLRMLPQGFPVLNKETGLRYSEALLVVRTNELHGTRTTYLCMVEPVPTDFINDALGSKNDGRASMFDRLGLTEADGSKIKVTTHQFRHYLNTIAQMGGLSQLDIAKWSGRVDVRQNAAYDHVSTDEMLLMIRNAVGDSSLMFGPLGAVPDRRLIPRDEFAQLKVPTAHVTDLGYCIHDFTMSPCEDYRDCINCEELVCIKGQCVKNAQVKRQLEETRELLGRAEAAQAEGQYGADRWTVHQRETVERLEQLASILDDPSVPVGSFISLAPPHARRLAGQPEIENRPQLRLVGEDSDAIKEI
ncbi:MAG TPA: hypothetical protein VN577_07200 [Terriglobales bacterium]|nr:hypothetical protein [Terriglobales bacterium]